MKFDSLADLYKTIGYDFGEAARAKTLAKPRMVTVRLHGTHLPAVDAAVSVYKSALPGMRKLFIDVAYPRYVSSQSGNTKPCEEIRHKIGFDVTKDNHLVLTGDSKDRALDFLKAVGQFFDFRDKRAPDTWRKKELLVEAGNLLP